MDLVRALGMVACVSFAAGPAFGQTRSEADRLFSEGTAALALKHYAEACEKLAQSQRLDPATGTLLALALCHDAAGKSATAWREYNEVVEAAAHENRSDRVKVARAKAAALEPHLPRLTLNASHVAALPGLELAIDGEVVGSPEWDQPFPIDPGDHVISVAARNRKSWKEHVVARSDDRAALTVPELEEIPIVAPVGGEATWKRTAGWTLVGSGGASFLVGVVFGIRAVVLSNDAKSHCPTSPCSDAAAVGENGDAQTSAWASDITLAVGVIALSVGGVLLFTGRHSTSPTSAFHVVPTVGRHGAGAFFEANW